MENNQPFVSIIMNCYNSDRYLETAIKSVINQSYKNWELIFWDNQSTDKSASIVKSFDDERVKYFYAPTHTPLGKARNLAIEKTQADWIAIIDCDDVWHVDKLKSSFELLENYKHKDEVSLIYSKTVYIDENGEKYSYFHEHYSGKIHDTLLTKGDFVFISSAIFRKDIFNSVGKIEESLHFAEDYDIILKVTKDYFALCVDEFYTYYRVHKNNLTNSKVYEYNLENFKFLNDYVKRNNLSKKLKFAIFFENSKRMTATVIKFLLKKDLTSMFKISKSYPQYLFLFPLCVVYFVLRSFRKKTLCV